MANESLVRAFIDSHVAPLIALTMKKASNLADVVDKTLARKNLDLEIGVDVLPVNAGQVTYNSNHTLTAADNGKIVYMDRSTAITLLCPQSSSKDLGAGFQVTVVNLGAGQVTVAVEGADFLRYPASKTAKLAERYAIAVVWKRTNAQWHIDGNLEAA